LQRNKKVLVSGGGGFVGKHLSSYLKNIGLDITSISRDKASAGLAIDITDLPHLLSVEDDIDVIIHLAAKTSISNSFSLPHDTYYTNLVGTLDLLEFARRRSVTRFIHLSTYVYGQPRYLPIDEKHPVDPHSPYNKSKLLSEKLCQFYSYDYDINIVTLRPFYLYGLAPRPNSFIHSIIEQIIHNNGKVVLSGKSTKRDFLFIDDFLILIEQILKRFPEGYNLYNVGSGKSCTLTNVAELLAKLLNKKISVVYDNKMRPDDITDMVADISKVSKEFDWKPSTSLEQGLERTVR
jgi:nucleoside-diphosphate-sugar epimerase